MTAAIDREAAVIKTTTTLAATLARISDLPVRGFRNGKSRYFMFGSKDRTIKTIYTYRKARAFAQGVAIGRKKESMKPSEIALSLANGVAVALLVICAPELGTAVALGALTTMVTVKVFQK